MIYIGIDPGKDGAMAMISETRKKPRVVAFEPNGIQEYHAVLQLRKSIMRVPYDYRDETKTICCLERVWGIKGQSASASFNFGENYGMIQGLLMAMHIPYQMVTPQKWKKEFQITGDKNSSIAVCKRLFPDVDLRKNERCRRDHDGKAEALLLAEYARRHMGGNQDGKE